MCGIGELPENPQKEDLVVYIEGPEKTSRLNVMGGPKSVYHIGFTPKEPGQYWVDFIFRGIWADRPHQLDISDNFYKVPAFPYQGIYRAQAKSGTVPQSQSMDSRSEEQDEMAAQQKIDDEKAQKEEEQKKKDVEEQVRKDTEKKKRKSD